MTSTSGFMSYLLMCAGLSAHQGCLAGTGQLAAQKATGRNLFSSFLTFIHVNRAKYQNFRDFILCMYIKQILPAVCPFD